MGTCNLDHTLEDVKKKFETQAAFLPSNIRDNLMDALGGAPSQAVLNETFHLLKKYDLSTEDEKESRNRGLEQIMAAGAEPRN